MNPIHSELVVLGGGPGGYAAAFYAADRAAKLIKEARESGIRGINFGEPTIDLEKMRAWKNSIVEKLVNGIDVLAKRRGVEVVHGRGYFEDAKTLRVETSEGQKFLTFDHAIIAVGSRSAMPAAFDLGNPR